MSQDWLTNLLPIINATGIPLLAIGIILLLRAYQKSTEAYKETSKHIREENDRLRERLAQADAAYFSEVEKMRAIVATSFDTIRELQARKMILLFEADDATGEAVLADVKKINEVIELLHGVSSIAKQMDVKIRENLFHLSSDFQGLTIQVGEVTSANVFRGLKHMESLMTAAEDRSQETALPAAEHRTIREKKANIVLLQVVAEWVKNSHPDEEVAFSGRENRVDIIRVNLETGQRVGYEIKLCESNHPVSFAFLRDMVQRGNLMLLERDNLDELQFVLVFEDESWAKKWKLNVAQVGEKLPERVSIMIGFVVSDMEADESRLRFFPLSEF